MTEKNLCCVSTKSHILCNNSFAVSRSECSEVFEGKLVVRKHCPPFSYKINPNLRPLWSLVK